LFQRKRREESTDLRDSLTAPVQATETKVHAVAGLLGRGVFQTRGVMLKLVRGSLSGRAINYVLDPPRPDLTRMDQIMPKAESAQE
jgi:hypothetical protein